ncbi:YceI family protein [Thiomicrorhabdus xiamenensis]|uniref:YceI family protein n=1 Tax=Thiomicrorhabdus xiamenensis TaxID=2739063 RepID=A0A7D4SR65_9GAMM|nr:YceI family protein [Thiomicrorhabdus xiamenensis]QKI88123.1 YceI family protein [Thiomicrorhabdus xiamenensis]
MKIKATLGALLLTPALLAAPVHSAQAAEYQIDTQGMHAAIQFKIKHLGYSWLNGRFEKFSGNYSYDSSKPGQSKVQVTIDTTSLNSNHAERDKHLRSKDFLNVSKYPQAKFVSTNVQAKGDKLTITGDFTLNGVTKPLTIDAHKIGEGKDPWGGYRSGFSGTTSFKMADYGITYDLGPASTEVFLTLDIEGVRK